MKFYNYIIFLFVLFCQGAYPQDYSKKVDDLNKEISVLAKQKKQKLKDKKKVEALLLKKEKEISKFESRLKKVEGEVNSKRSSIKKLKKLIQKDQNNAVKTEKQKQDMLYGAYKLSQVNYVKLLLSQNDPNAVIRNKDYFGYLLKYKDTHLRQLQLSITGLHQDQEQLNKKIEALKKTEKNYLKERRKLNIAQAEREKLIAKLGSDISATSKQIKKLSANRARLKNLIASLKKQKQTLPKYTPKQGSFVKQRSRLPYPVAGSIVNSYGKQISGSRLKSNGVTLKTTPNTRVKAIYDGQVIFAKALKGFGNLIIVDHGGSYMSLYANNKVLSKNVGDIVEAGDTLAKTGIKNDFYFEIRHKGKPVNPAKWCKL